MSSVISVDKRTQLIVSGFIRINCPIYIPLVIIKLISLFKKLHDKFSYIEGECKFDQDRTTITTYESCVILMGKITFNPVFESRVHVAIFNQKVSSTDTMFYLGFCNKDKYDYKSFTRLREGDMIEMKLKDTIVSWKINGQSFHRRGHLTISELFRFYIRVPWHSKLQMTDSTFFD